MIRVIQATQEFRDSLVSRDSRALQANLVSQGSADSLERQVSVGSLGQVGNPGSVVSVDFQVCRDSQECQDLVGYPASAEPAEHQDLVERQERKLWQQFLVESFSRAA